MLVDMHGVEWRFNLTNLTLPTRDYEVDTGSNGKLVLNVCRPPVSACRPQGGNPIPPTTPTAIVYTGPPPPSNARCGAGVCTARCQKLGWGALAGTGAHWSLIDPAEAHEGVRVSHYELAFSSADLSSNSSIPPARDEWGNPRPAAFTVDFLCDPTAPLPAGPLDAITLFGQPRADTTVRMKTPAACPILNPSPVVGAAAANAIAAAAVAAAAATAAAHGAAVNGAPPNAFVMLLAFVAALGILALLLIWFAPLSMKRGSMAPSYPTAWPVAHQQGWAAVHGGETEEFDGRSAYRAM